VLEEPEKLRVATWPVTWPVTWPLLSKQILCDSDFLKGMLKNANIVGQNVVKFRHRAGWTQDVLAAKIQLLGCYMTRDIIANIETRRSPVTDKRIAILAEVFGVAVGNLFPPTPPAFKRQTLSLESRPTILFRIGRADKAMLELLRRNQAQAEAIVGTGCAEFHHRWKLEGRCKVSFKSAPQSGA
jgi:transcriptional regulator with XRE-family HTH domain